MREYPHQTYLRRAQEVEALASKIDYEVERAALLKIAAEWRRLAEEVMHREGRNHVG